MIAFLSFWAAICSVPQEGPKKPPVSITIDVSDAPDAKEWAEKAKTLCEKWYPQIEEYLKTANFTPPRKVKIVFKKDYKGIAATSHATIEVSADWIQKHPDDLGMIIHELTHAIQSYKGGEGWLVEGIADYVRYFLFEPSSKPRKVGSKANYKDGYKTSAVFLDWAQKKYDKELVKKLNESLRRSEYKSEIFEKLTGKDLDALWEEFLRSQ